MKYLYLILLTSAVSCGDGKSTARGAVDSTSYTTNVIAPNAWIYSVDSDPITDAKRKTATIIAKDPLDFPIPYDGGASVRLVVMQRSGKDEVLLQLSKGQFFGSVITARFDSTPATAYRYTQPADGSLQSIFVTNERDFIKRLGKANTLLIRAPFYKAGEKDIIFNVSGFKW